ncbi:MAG: carboxypeptidase regulatory-like domain-containing protein [Gemmatimonadaceae bacterium]|nr:carboxypeptidase regulatory-like domain-containing protein [Gemmatimonadaceae bacterium]
MTRVLAWCCGVLLLMTARVTAAQPAAYSINGTVRSEADRTPLAGATVELSSARFTRRLRTDEGGRFRFGTVPVGTYRLSVLRLGYAPLSRQVSVVDADAELDVTLIPDARTLGAIVTQANVTAVFGGIGAAGLNRNAAGERPLDIARGARVQVLGSGAETETDSTGRFFLEVKKPGRYLVRVSAPGLVPQVYSVDVPRNKAVDASRLIDSARVTVAERPEYLAKEMDKRLAWRPFNSAIVTGDEVREYGGSLGSALQRSRGVASRGLRFGSSVCVFVDGIPRPGMSPDAIRPEEVEAIEVYGKNEDTKSLAMAWRGAPCTPSRQLGANAIVWVVIWTVR